MPHAGAVWGCSGGYFIAKLHRYLMLEEMATLQGLPHAVLAAMLAAAGGNRRLVGQAIGDAMSVNVLMRLLPRALHSAGLLENIPTDVWRNASKSGLTFTPDQLL